MDELAEKLTTWIDRGGIPLEYEAARTLAEAGFDVSQGRGCQTEYDGQMRHREIDALGSLGQEEGPIVHLVLECKHTHKGHPWLIMANDREMDVRETLRCLVASDLAGRSPRHAAEKSSYRRGHPSFFQNVKRPGFAALAAVDLTAEHPFDRDDRNAARDALAQAVGAARGL